MRSVATPTRQQIATAVNGDQRVMRALEAVFNLYLSGVVTLPAYDVADLPEPIPGNTTYVQNALKPWEATGHGTGVPAFADIEGWKSFLDGSPVVA